MFRLFRLPLLSLLVISVLCTACQKGHDMDDMAMDSAYMNIMMDMMTQMDAQGKRRTPITTTLPRWSCTTRPPS